MRQARAAHVKVELISLVDNLEINLQPCSSFKLFTQAHLDDNGET